SAAISAAVSLPTSPAARVSRATTISWRACPPPGLAPASGSREDGAACGGTGAGPDDARRDAGAGDAHPGAPATGDGDRAGDCGGDGCGGSVRSSARVISSVPCNIPGPSPWALARPPAG